MLFTPQDLTVLSALTQGDAQATPLAARCGLDPIVVAHTCERLRAANAVRLAVSPIVAIGGQLVVPASYGLTAYGREVLRNVTARRLSRQRHPSTQRVARDEAFREIERRSQAMVDAIRPGGGDAA